MAVGELREIEPAVDPNLPDRLRLFVALEISTEAKAAMQQAQTELQRKLGRGCLRWTRPEQFHLTLKFLGDVDTSRVEALAETLRTACRGFGPITLRAETVGTFPNFRSPRVVWVGVSDRLGRLPLLQRAVENAADKLNAESQDDSFVGHVTLGRIKGINRREAENLKQLAIGMADRMFGEWVVTEVGLLRSELFPEGSRHTTLFRLALSGAS